MLGGTLFLAEAAYEHFPNQRVLFHSAVGTFKSINLLSKMTSKGARMLFRQGSGQNTSAYLRALMSTGPRWVLRYDSILLRLSTHGRSKSTKSDQDCDLPRLVVLLPAYCLSNIHITTNVACNIWTLV